MVTAQYLLDASRLLSTPNRFGNGVAASDPLAQLEQIAEAMQNAPGMPGMLPPVPSVAGQFLQAAAMIEGLVPDPMLAQALEGMLLQAMLQR
jgi:hypothetical protein